MKAYINQRGDRVVIREMPKPYLENAIRYFERVKWALDKDILTGYQLTQALEACRAQGGVPILDNAGSATESVKDCRK